MLFYGVVNQLSLKKDELSESPEGDSSGAVIVLFLDALDGEYIRVITLKITRLVDCFVPLSECVLIKIKVFLKNIMSVKG